MSLAEKIRKAREIRVPVGGHVFIVRRPTDLELFEIGGSITPRRMCTQFLVGWEGVTGIDILGHAGDGHPVPFDPETAVEWLGDKPALLGDLLKAAVKAYGDAHQSDAEAKKP